MHQLYVGVRAPHAGKPLQVEIGGGFQQIDISVAPADDRPPDEFAPGFRLKLTFHANEFGVVGVGRGGAKRDDRRENT